MAAESGKALVIHTREADDATVGMLAEHARGVRVIMHCFSMPDRLDEVLDHGWFVSFAGNVTYPKNDALADAAARVPAERLLVETDAPYLTPQAVRKERPAPPAPPESHAKLLRAFHEAVTSGDVAKLASLLRADAIMLSDGGGRKLAALNPIHGAEKIARFFTGIMRKRGNQNLDIRIEPATINGSFGALLYLDGELDQTISLAIDGDKIAAIYLVRNPDKLHHVPASQH